MKELLNTTEFIFIHDKNDKSYYTVRLNEELVHSKIINILDTISINKDDFINKSNDVLYNQILKRIVSSLFKEKHTLVENKPYVLEFAVKSLKYKLAITKVNTELVQGYMEGYIL